MILFGASGHCKVVIDLLNLNNIKIDKILDDNPKVSKVFDIPVFKNDGSIDFQSAIIAIGNNKDRKKISELYNLDYKSFSHPSAVISSFANFGFGNVFLANCTVNADARFGNHCIVNSNSVVEHDCEIADFVHITPSASIAGNVKIGEGTQIGIGAKVIQGIKIGKWCIVGAGAVVIRDLPDFAVAVGNPAKIIRYCDES